MNIDNEIKRILRKKGSSIHIGDRSHVFVASYLFDEHVHCRFEWTGGVRYVLARLVAKVLVDKVLEHTIEQVYRFQSLPTNQKPEDMLLHSSFTTIHLSNQWIEIVHKTHKINSLGDNPGVYQRTVSARTLDEAFAKLLVATPKRI